ALLKETVAAKFDATEVLITGVEDEIAKAFPSLPFDHLVFTGSTRVGRLVAERSLQAFAEKVRAQMRRMFGTDPANKDYTSVISDRHYARLENLVADAAQRGAKILQPAKADDPNWKSHRKFPPTLILGATEDMAVMQEEIFGPVLPVLGTREPADAIAFINRRDRPLALYWFGKDAAARNEVLSRTVSGGVTI